MTKVNIVSKKNFTQEEDTLLNKAVALIEQVINSEAFRKRIIDFSFNGKKKFNFNRGMKNEEIFNLLLSGEERYNNQADTELDFILEIGDECPQGVVGVTIGGKRTKTYRCKLNEMNAAEYAGHLIHEYCHYLGFTHTKNHNATRKYTVPYAIGYIVRDLATILLLNLPEIDSEKAFSSIPIQPKLPASGKIYTKKYSSDEIGNVGVEYFNDSMNFISEVFHPVHKADSSDAAQVCNLRFWESCAVFTLDSQNPLAAQSIEILNEAFLYDLEIEVIYDESLLIKEINYPDTEIHAAHYQAMKESADYLSADKVAMERAEAVLIPEIESPEKLAEIFAYIKQQACHSEHAEIDVCIPFHYKKDGCYARAHKMKQIIENKFGYAIRKIFSYDAINPRQNSTYTLAVKDNDRCIFWWYHVAPLVKVRNNTELSEFVIDPSIADKPLLIDEWISKQESDFCSATARVGSTETREAFIYFPNGFRDDNYYNTNKTLRKYRRR
jgi:hypothetical protein